MKSGAESGALIAPDAGFDPELAAVVEAWPALPDAIKTAIRALVNSVCR